MRAPLHKVMQKLPWPLPALLVWASGWVLFTALPSAGVPHTVAGVLACLASAAASMLGISWWRRLMIAMGFPLSLLLTQAASLPAWVWLLPLLVLLLVYPLNAWRDAPVFPTPNQALNGLAAHVPLAPDAIILDAGCGLGDGLKALHDVYPNATLQGLEWSWPLRALCALRCPWAQVRQGDIWQANWSAYTLVYLFQRPESMNRAVAKAAAEMQPDAWLVSLEFEASSIQPAAVLQTLAHKPVWVYRLPFTPTKKG